MSTEDDERDLPEPDAGRTAEYPTMVYPPTDQGEQAEGADAQTGFDGADDPEADAEWVVQTTRGIRLALPAAGLVAVVLVAGGFWAGAAVEKSHGSSSSGSGLASLAARFRSARTGGTSTTSTSTTAGSGAGGFGGFGGFASSAAATGTVSVVAGDTVYVLTSGGSLVKVTLTPSTTITRNADTTAVDLRPGDTVVVQGTTSSNGNVSATSVAATAPGVSSAGGFGGGGLGASTGATSTTAGG